MTKQLILLVASAVLLSACTHTATTSSTDQPQTTETQQDEFAAVTAALSAGQSATCTIAKADGSNTMNYQAKGKKVRMTGLTSESVQGAQYSSMIMDDEFLYSWDDATKKGVKFPILDPQATPTTDNQAPQAPDLTDETTRQDYLDDGYTVNCQVGAVPDSAFVPPSDVTFTDMSALMQNSQQLLQQTNTTPTGDAPTPEQQQQAQEQLDQLMQQYGQQ